MIFLLSLFLFAFPPNNSSAISKDSFLPKEERFQLDLSDLSDLPEAMEEIWYKLQELEESIAYLQCLQRDMYFKIQEIHEFLAGKEIEVPQATAKTP